MTRKRTGLILPKAGNLGQRRELFPILGWLSARDEKLPLPQGYPYAGLRDASLAIKFRMKEREGGK